MKFLWSKDMRINTVHVRDLCRALLFLQEKGKVGEVYNVVDKNDTSARVCVCACVWLTL